MRGHSLGSGSRRWRPFYGLGRWGWGWGCVQQHWSTSRMVTGRKKNMSHGPKHPYMFMYCKKSDAGRGHKRKMVLERLFWEERDGPRFGGKDFLKVKMRDSWWGKRSQRQWCWWISVATVREHPVHRRRLGLSYISVGYISFCSRLST